MNRTAFPALAITISLPLAAQCTLDQLPSYGLAAGPAVMSPLGPSALGAAHNWNGDLVIGGGLNNIGGVQAIRVARWDGTAWNNLPGNGTNGVNGAVRTLGTLPNGDLLIGGDFSMAGGQPSANIARYGAGGWTTGFVINSSVNCHAFLPNGDLVIGGQFTAANGVPANRVARFDGSIWHPLGAGFDGIVYALHVTAFGDLIAGGNFANSGSTATDNIARWDGAAWQPLASGATNGVVYTIAEHGGDLVCGGSFAQIGGVAADRTARFDGVGWQPLSTGSTNGLVYQLQTLPDGTLAAVGSFSVIGGVAAVGVARWNGSSWQSLGASFGGGTPVAATLTDDDELVLVGGFSFAGGVSSPYLCRIASTCPASTATIGAGCPWAGGASPLNTATAMLGQNWSSSASNLPPTAIVAAVYGLATTSLPLANLFSAAGPSCTLHVQPDVLDIGITTIGWFPSFWSIPNDPALAGATFHHQMVAIGLGPQGAFASASATEARSLTIGTF